jgi:hypothetical protein
MGFRIELTSRRELREDRTEQVRRVTAIWE